MADRDARRRKKSTAAPLKLMVFGRKLRLSRRELLLLGGCVLFLCIAVVGMLASGRPKAPAEEPAVPPPPQEEEPPPPEPFRMSRAALSLEAGGQAVLSVSGAAGPVAWTSSDEKVATVAGGAVTAVGGGTATVTAESGGERASCAVTVSGDPYAGDLDLYLNHTDFTLRAADPPVQMKVKVRETKEAYGGSVVWESADPSVATVSETGLVQRAGRGRTTVTATVGGKTLECIVRVP